MGAKTLKPVISANKIAAATSAAGAQANDATARLAGQGAQFSENAFGRLSGANMAIAGQKRQNRNEFNAAKAQLISASNQNIFNGISNAASAGLTAWMDKKGGGNGSAYGSYLQMQNGGQQGFRFDPYTGQPIGN